MTEVRKILIPAALLLAAASWGPVLRNAGPVGWYTGWEASVTGVFCHRQPDRCFTAPSGDKTAACARCTGIMTGLLAGAWFAVPVNAGPLLLAALTGNTVEWTIGMSGSAGAGNTGRLILGFILGLLFSVTLMQTKPIRVFSWKNPLS